MRRIHTKIVIDLQTNQTLLEEGYWYDGPVAECKGYGGDFQRQATGSYQNIEQAANNMNNLAGEVVGMMGERFGRQSRTYDILQGGIQQAVAAGPARYQYDKNFGGLGSGAGQAGGGSGGGGGGARGEGTGSSTDFGSQFDFGYNEGVIREPEWDRLETVMRTEASEENTNAFQNAAMAYGDKALQYGTFGKSLTNAALSDLYEGQAAGEATGQRDVLKFIEGGKIDYSKLMNQLREDMYTKAASNRVADMASKRAAAAANRATGASSRAARAALAQQAAMFQQQMQLNYKQAQDAQFFNGLGLAGNVAGLQQGDWQGAGQLGAGLYSGVGNMFGNVYNTASQGAATTNTSWGGILGGILSGAAKFGIGTLTGGTGTALDALSGFGTGAAGAAFGGLGAGAWTGTPGGAAG